MTAQILDGEALAADIKSSLVARIEALADRGITPGLGTVLVGDDGPSANYVAAVVAGAGSSRGHAGSN